MSGLLKRAFYRDYESDAGQLEAGGTPAKLTDVVVLSICDFELWPHAGQDSQKLPRPARAIAPAIGVMFS
jgi:hypothetical protein